MTKSNKLIIGIIGVVVIVGSVLGIFGFIKGLQNTQHDPSLPSEAVSAFQKTLTERALVRGPHPIEGFDASMLLDIFPGLEESDFDGVETGIMPGEGMHSYVNGELQWERTSNQPITSAERTILTRGYGVLLENLSERLNMPVMNAEEAIAIIDAIDVRKEWETATDPVTGITFRYPETLTAKYINTVDWPPHIRILDEPFDCSEAGEETDRAGGTKEHRVDGRTYCVTTVTEGAAGSIYRQYAYAFPYNNQTAIFTFSLRFSQCDNYDEPQRVECKSERETLDVDNLIDRIMQTMTLETS